MYRAEPQDVLTNFFCDLKERDAKLTWRVPTRNRWAGMMVAAGEFRSGRPTNIRITSMRTMQTKLAVCANTKKACRGVWKWTRATSLSWKDSYNAASGGYVRSFFPWYCIAYDFIFLLGFVMMFFYIAEVMSHRLFAGFTCPRTQLLFAGRAVVSARVDAHGGSVFSLAYSRCASSLAQHWPVCIVAGRLNGTRSMVTRYFSGHLE